MFNLRKFGMLALLGVALVGCGRVTPGNVGVLVDQYGSDKGVQDKPIPVGRIWFNPLTHDLYIYPTFMQTSQWTAEKGESITFNSSEGSKITADISLSYTLDPEKVPKLFSRFRQDIDTITHGYLRTKVKDAFQQVGENYKAIDLISIKKAELLGKVKERLQSELNDVGFMIDTVSFISAPTPDESVMGAINNVVTATQRALEAENKVKQIEAEARQAVAMAEGKADAVKAAAEGEAERILTEAKAQAEANQILAASLTPELVKYKTIETWDGKLPMVSSGDGANLLFQVPTPAQPAK